MNNSQTKKINPRKVFWKCGTCSNAMFHLLNHEFENIKLQEEKASDLLAGGIVQKGHQCGMLWGGSLAIGLESYRRNDDKNLAIATAINTSKELVDSFQKRTQYVNCKDITKVDWENKLHMTFYMLKTIAQGLVFSPCFNLIVKWTPEAIQAANKGLSENKVPKQACLSCSTEVLKKMGATEEESIMVAGFAGGIGLSGRACGALAASLYYKMLDWSRKNPSEKLSYFDNPIAEEILNTFNAQTDSEMLCNSICGTYFKSVEEHSEYIKNGGCRNLIEALSMATK